MLERLLSWLTRGRSEAPPAPAAQPEAPPMDLLTPRDRSRLRGVHPDLVRVVERARRAEEFFVAEGLRTVERQRELFAAGKSKTMQSRHLTGHAVDLYPISTKPIAQMTAADFKGVVAAMRAAAEAEGVAMEHGHDWGWDSPHHELAREAYP